MKWIMNLGLNSAPPRLLASFPTLSSNLKYPSQANYQGKFIYRQELKNCPHQKCHFEVHTTLLTIIEMTVLPRSLHRPWRPPRKMNFTLQIWCIKCLFWILRSVCMEQCATACVRVGTEWHLCPIYTRRHCPSPFAVYLPFLLHSTHVPDQTACLQGCPWCLPLEPAAARRR